MYYWREKNDGLNKKRKSSQKYHHIALNNNPKDLILLSRRIFTHTHIYNGESENLAAINDTAAWVVAADRSEVEGVDV